MQVSDMSVRIKLFFVESNLTLTASTSFGFK